MDSSQRGRGRGRRVSVVTEPREARLSHRLADLDHPPVACEHEAARGSGARSPHRRLRVGTIRRSATNSPQQESVRRLRWLLLLWRTPASAAPPRPDQKRSDMRIAIIEPIKADTATTNHMT